MARRSSLLKPKHFKDHLTLGERGLEFDVWIDELDRACCICDDLDVPHERPATRVVVNPKEHPAAKVAASLKRAKARYLPEERMNVVYGLPGRSHGNQRRVGDYELEWQFQIDEGIDAQHLVFVCFDGRRPVGYAGCGFGLWWDDDSPDLTASLSLSMVYVAPQARGRGFGIDLSVAMSLAGRQFLDALYRAARPGAEVSASVTADYESDGGEAITRQLAREIECHLDFLREDGNRSSIRLGSCALDAGW